MSPSPPPLSRQVKLVEVEVEPQGSTWSDAGNPTFEPMVLVNARIVLTTDEVVTGDGSTVRTELDLLVPPDAPYVPKEGDRVTWNGRKYIGEQASSAPWTDMSIHHHRLKCRREGR